MTQMMEPAFPTNKASALCFALVFVLFSVACAKPSANAKVATSAPEEITDKQGMIGKDVPEKVNPKARYLFYLHGRIIEEQGVRPTSPQHGVYEYEQILETFRDAGFVVISEARAKNTDPERYAEKVVAQIKNLLKAQLPPDQITVVGASKGAVISMLVSTYLKNREVNFVLLASCNDDMFKRFDINLWGNVLSIYDVKDEYGQSCQKFFDKATGLNKHKEIEVRLGIGHGLLYRPIKEWIEPTIEWARNSYSPK
jgi:hypothetical protein